MKNLNARQELENFLSKHISEKIEVILEVINSSSLPSNTSDENELLSEWESLIHFAISQNNYGRFTNRLLVSDRDILKIENILFEVFWYHYWSINTQLIDPETVVFVVNGECSNGQEFPEEIMLP